MRIGRKRSSVEVEWREFTDGFSAAVEASQQYTSYYRHLRCAGGGKPKLTFERAVSTFTGVPGSIYVPAAPVTHLIDGVLAEINDRDTTGVVRQALSHENAGMAVARWDFRILRRPEAVRVVVASIVEPIPEVIEMGFQSTQPGYRVDQKTEAFHVDREQFGELSGDGRFALQGIVTAVRSEVSRLYDGGRNPTPSIIAIRSPGTSWD